MEAAGDLVMLDAQAMLGSFMVGGRPDASLFQATAARQLDRLGDRPIRVFGEGVDVLWKAGLGDAAIRLEMLWNKLTLGRDIKTLCAYSVSNFYKDTSLRAIFDEHSHVVSDKGATIHAHPTVRWGWPSRLAPAVPNRARSPRRCLRRLDGGSDRQRRVGSASRRNPLIASVRIAGSRSTAGTRANAS